MGLQPINLHVYIYPTSSPQDVTQCQFFKQIKTSLNSEFLLLRLVALQSLKNTVCPSIYPLLGRRRTDGCFFALNNHLCLFNFCNREFLNGYTPTGPL